LYRVKFQFKVHACCKGHHYLVIHNSNRLTKIDLSV